MNKESRGNDTAASITNQLPIGDQVAIELQVSDNNKDWYQTSVRLSGVIMAMPTTGNIDPSKYLNVFTESYSPVGSDGLTNRLMLIPLEPQPKVLSDGREVTIRYIARIVGRYQNDE